MKNRLYLSLSVVAVLLLIGGAIHAQLQRSSSGKQLWEYKSIIIVREVRSNAQFSDWVEITGGVVKQLPGPVSVPVKANELGEQGWELVSITPISNNACGGSTNAECAGFTSQILYFFKRPK